MFFGYDTVNVVVFPSGLIRHRWRGGQGLKVVVAGDSVIRVAAASRKVQVELCFADLVLSARSMPVASKKHAPAAKRFTAQRLIIERLIAFLQ